MLQVNKINSLTPIARPSFKESSKVANTLNTVSEDSLNGATALAAYNMAVIKHAQKNPFLTPAPRFVPDSNLEATDGEKTYYPNGKLEKIVNKQQSIFFSPNGELSEIDIPNKTIKFEEDGFQTIEERLDNDTTKITKRCKDDGISVTLQNRNHCSEIHYDKDKPVAFSESFVITKEFQN